MPERISFVNQDKVLALNEKVRQLGSVDREHILEFLTLVETNDADTIVKEVKVWLAAVHSDPNIPVNFPPGDIEAIIGDLDSYGRVQPETIMQFKQASNRSLPLQ